jgi:hypothetical protein
MFRSTEYWMQLQCICSPDGYLSSEFGPKLKYRPNLRGHTPAGAVQLCKRLSIEPGGARLGQEISDKRFSGMPDRLRLFP